MVHPILIGALLGALFAIFARMRRGAESRVLALGLVVAALIYVGLALAAPERRWLLIELAGVVLYAAIAWLGLRFSPWWLALGWVGHVGWDVGLHLDRPQSLVGDWYPLLCVGFDLVVAGFVVNTSLALARSRPQTA